MRKFKDTDYLNISMRIKSRQTGMMGADAFSRMADCKNVGEATVFASDFFGQGTDFEQMLASDEINTYKFIKSNIPDKSLSDILAIRRDYANIKALVKAELRNISPDGMLVECGILSKEDAQKAYTDRDSKALNGKFVEAINAAQNIYAKTGDPQKIDLVIDEMCYSEMKRMADESAFRFLADFVGIKIDVLNILSFIRQKTIGKDVDFFKSSILDGGYVFTKNTLSSFYTEGLEAFFAKLNRTKYSPIISEVSAEAPNPSLIEKNADKFICEIIKNMKSTPFGPQVVAGYLLSKEYEIKNARIVMSGVASNNNKESITERLRLGYE